MHHQHRQLLLSNHLLQNARVRAKWTEVQKMKMVRARYSERKEMSNCTSRHRCKRLQSKLLTMEKWSSTRFNSNRMPTWLLEIKLIAKRKRVKLTKAKIVTISHRREFEFRSVSCSMKELHRELLTLRPPVITAC